MCMQNTSFLYFDILTLTFKQKIIFFSAYIHIFEWVSIAHFYIYPHIYSTVCHMALFPLLLYVCFSLVKVCVSSFKPAKSHVWIFWGHFFTFIQFSTAHIDRKCWVRSCSHNISHLKIHSKTYGVYLQWVLGSPADPQLCASMIKSWI